MADLRKTVEILFLATDQTGEGISSIGKNLEDITGPVADLTKSFLLLEAAIAAIGIAFAAKAFDESVKFESALLDLQKVLGEGEGKASDYTDQVDELSLRFGESATDILQGAADIRQAGFNVEEAFNLQEVALTGAVISELDVIETTNLLIRSLKGFKAPVEDANRLLDLFNEVSNKNATNVRELATGFSELSPVASKLGLSFEETNALLTPIIETFGSGSEAGNALKIALTSLIVPTGPARDELEKLGIAVEDSGGKLRSGRDIVFELIEAMSAMDSTQQVATLSIIAGERQSARLSESLGNLAAVNKVLADQTGATGSAQDEFNIRIAATEKEIDKAGVAFNLLARNIGDKFKPELAGAIVGIRDIQIAFAELVAGGGLDPFIDAITPQLTKLEDVLKGIAEALPEAWEDVNFKPITDALKSIFEGADTLFDGLDLSRPEDLAKVLNRLVEVGASFISTTEGIVAIFGTVGGAILDVIEFFGSLDSSTQRLIGAFGGVSLAINAFAPIIASVGAAIGTLGAVGGPLVAVIGLLTGPVGLAVAITAGAAALLGWIDIQEDAIAKNEKLAGSIETAAIAFKRLGFTTFESFQEALRSGEVVFDEIAGKYKETATTIKDEANKAAESILAIGEAATEAGEKSEDASAQTAEDLKRNQDLAKAMGNEYRAIGDTIVKVGSDAEKALVGVEDSTKGVFITLADGTKVTGEAALAFNNLNKATDERIKKDKEAEKALTQRIDALSKFKLGIEEIQSKERVALFELKAEVDIAQIESATKIFTGLIETVQTGIESTGQNITSLFEILAGSTVPGLSLDIKAAIEREFDLRERQVTLQEDITEEQLATMRARREALERGDAQIIVRAEGLEPHLQEILRSILEAAQIEVNATQQELLLGIGEVV